MKKPNRKKRILKYPIFPKMECDDCKKRPVYMIADLIFNAEDMKLCNRHFYLFSKKFEKWFLEDKFEIKI